MAGASARARARHRVEAERVVALDGRRARGAPAAVEAVELAAAGVVEQHEDIAAEAAELRIDDLERGAGRDGGVQRVAASLEQV